MLCFAKISSMLNPVPGEPDYFRGITTVAILYYWFLKNNKSCCRYVGLRASGQYTDNLLFTGPDGLKIQVFRRTLANQTTVGVINTVPVTFPVPFPVNCWGVFSTKSTWVQITNSCEWVSNTGFTAQVMMNIAVDTNTSEAMFLAIGY